MSSDYVDMLTALGIAEQTSLLLLDQPAAPFNVPQQTTIRVSEPYPLAIVRRILFERVRLPDLFAISLVLGGRGGYPGDASAVTNAVGWTLPAVRLSLGATYIQQGWPLPSSLLRSGANLQFTATNDRGLAFEPIMAWAEVLAIRAENVDRAYELLQKISGMVAQR